MIHRKIDKQAYFTKLIWLQNNKKKIKKIIRHWNNARSVRKSNAHVYWK